MQRSSSSASLSLCTTIRNLVKPMKVAIHQPQYFPWPRYLHKVMSSDVFVYLDTVQYEKNGMQNRNQVKSPQGTAWLTVPIRHHSGQRIRDVEIAEPRAFQKHAQCLASNYARTPGYRRWSDEINAILLGNNYTRLVDIAIASTEWLLKKLGGRARCVRASALDVALLRGSEAVADICAQLGATTYLTGRGALEYLKPEHFSAVGCDVNVQAWRLAPYEQVHPSRGFIPDLSALDLVLSHPDDASSLVGQAGRWEFLWGAS